MTFAKIAAASFCLAVLIPAASSALAADVVIAVTGVETATGDIACALFANAEGFPLDVSAAVLQRAPARGGGDACRFHGLKAGAYAVSVAQLPSGQANVEKDFLGRPKQPWGVSNNVRPTLRAPSFAEAAFTVRAEDAVRVNVTLAK